MRSLRNTSVNPRNEELYADLRAETEAFLQRAGYRTTQEKRLLFARASLYGEKERSLFVCQVETGLDRAVEGLKNLCTAKCLLSDKADYALALPPMKEHHLIEFLTEGDAWFQDLRSQFIMIWVVNHQNHTLDNIIGSPRDRELEKSFTHNHYPGFMRYLNKILDQKIMAEGL